MIFLSRFQRALSCFSLIFCLLGQAVAADDLTTASLQAPSNNTDNTLDAQPTSAASDVTAASENGEQAVIADTAAASLKAMAQDGGNIDSRLSVLFNKAQTATSELNGPFDTINIEQASLTLHFTDIDVPVSGSQLRLQLTRSYQSGVYPRVTIKDGKHHRYKFDQFWQFHPGYIVKKNVNSSKKEFNPYLLLPDGNGLEIIRNPNSSPSFVTRNHWQVVKSKAEPGYIITTTSGIRQEYLKKVDTRVDGKFRYYLTRQEDSNGNWINYEYDEDDFWVAATSSSGNKITIDWDMSNGTFVPMQASLDGEVKVTYNTYIEKNAVVEPVQLQSVTFSNGTRWGYQYRTVDVRRHSRCRGNFNYAALTNVSMPDGSDVYYDYDVDPSYYRLGHCANLYHLAKKSVYNQNKEVWQWEIGKADVIADYDGDKLMRRLVTTPTNSIHFFFSSQKDGYIWRTGQLLDKVTYADHDINPGVIIKREKFTWSPHEISSQEDINSPWYAHRNKDHTTSNARLDRYELELGKAKYVTDYQNYDEYDNPATVIETHGEHRQQYDFTYAINKEHNLVHQVANLKLNKKAYLSRSYDEHGNLLTETVRGVTTSNTYNEQGDLSSSTDAKDSTTKYANYSHGVAQEITDPLGNVTSQVVNRDGSIAMKTDALGNTTSYNYDVNGRLTATLPPLGNATSVSYLRSEQATTTKGQRQDVTKLDIFGNTLENVVTDLATNESIRTINKYDGQQRLVFRSFPHAASDTAGQNLGVYTSYDAIGRVTSACTPTPSGNCTRISYPDGDTKIITRANGATKTITSFGYGAPNDKLHRIVEDGLTTSYQYDDWDQLQEVTQAGLSRHFQYDEHGYLIAETHPEVGSIDFKRDLLGNLLQKHYQASNNSIDYSLDAKNRVTNITGPNIEKIFSYDANDNLIAATTSNINWVHAYDAMGHLTKSTATIAGHAPLTFQYQYDDMQQLGAMIYPSGKKVAYQRNNFDRATRVGDFVSDISYTPSGQLASLQRALGDTLQITFDGLKRPIGLQDGVLAQSYSYDDVDNITAITDRNHPERSLHLEYDLLDRLTCATGPWGDLRYQYDGNNNLDRKTLGNTSVEFTYLQGRLQSVSSVNTALLQYDSQGNIANRGGSVAYATGETMAPVAERLTFDALNRLTTASHGGASIHYQYDANDRATIIEKAGQKRTTLYDQQGHKLFEEGDGTQQEFFYLDARLIASTESQSAPIYYHWDNQGHVVAARSLGNDGKPSLLFEKVYYPFGNMWHNTDTAIVNVGYSGKVFDAEVGLSDFGARFYDPELARFLSIDPADINIEQTMTFNRYLYVNNNPYKYVDLDGREAKYNYSITEKQREFASTGNRAGFWKSRLQDSHDPVGKIGLKALNNDGSILDYLFGGQAINNRMQAYSRVYNSGHLDLDEVGVKLMNAHMDAVNLDDNGEVGLLNPRQIATYHHEVFKEYGLPPTTFGGTPMTGNLFEANLTRFIWCTGCDWN